jgi:hypothetical protein
MPSTHLWNEEYDRYFVNKSARLSHDLVCKISISTFFWSSPPNSYKSLSLLIPMPSTHLWNEEYGIDFVNKSASLSHDLVSDGEICTAHGGVNPCGLFVRRGGV